VSGAIVAAIKQSNRQYIWHRQLKG